MADELKVAKDQVREAMGQPCVKRLAVIMSNDYSTLPPDHHLTGTNNDNEAMVRAFKSLSHFAVVSIQNDATKEVI